MPRINSFFLSPQDWSQENFCLSGEESYHLLRVLRAQEGQVIRLFNGQGQEGTFKIKKICGKKVFLEPLSQFTHPQPTPKVYLALAWQRASKRDIILEKSVELKVWKIIFWPGQFSPPCPQQIKKSWLSKLIAAAKQSQNPWLPQIEFQPSLEQLIKKYQRIPQKIFFWEKERDNLLLDLELQKEILVTIGPEGGFAHEEVNLLQTKNFEPVSLGDSILRIETAVILGVGGIYLKHLQDVKNSPHNYPDYDQNQVQSFITQAKHCSQAGNKQQ